MCRETKLQQSETCQVMMGGSTAHLNLSGYDESAVTVSLLLVHIVNGTAEAK